MARAPGGVDRRQHSLKRRSIGHLTAGRVEKQSSYSNKSKTRSEIYVPAVFELWPMT